MADKSTEGTGKKRRVERRFIDAKTGEEIGKSSVVTAADDVAREVTVHHVTAKGDPGKKRPIAIALWVVAIIFEVLAWLVYNGTIANLPGKLMMWLIIFIVADLVCVIIAGQLWKKANHIDPPSEANKASFFLKSQLGAILAAVGTGLYSSVPEACDAIIRTNEPLMPDAEQAKIYDGYFRLYDRLYQALKPEYKELTKLYY